MTARIIEEDQPRFTPGPWTLTHIEGSNFAIQRFEIRGMLGSKPNVYPVFNRNASAIDCGSIYVSPQDANLISAAPDLYEALKAIVDDVMAGDDVGAFQVAKHAGLSALAKARGQ